MGATEKSPLNQWPSTEELSSEFLSDWRSSSSFSFACFNSSTEMTVTDQKKTIPKKPTKKPRKKTWRLEWLELPQPNQQPNQQPNPQKNQHHSSRWQTISAKPLQHHKGNDLRMIGFKTNQSSFDWLIGSLEVLPLLW